MHRTLKTTLLAVLLSLLSTTAFACWDGSGNCVRDTGVYTGSSVWASTRDAGRAIRADDMDTHGNTLATGIEGAIAKSGENTPTANLPMGGFEHTNVGSSTARNQYGTVAQIQDGDYLELGSVSGTNTITAAASPTLSAYATGQVFYFVAAGTNTGATTININAIGAKAIQKLQAALASGDITSGDLVQIAYDGTQFQMLSPIPAATLTKTGSDSAVVSGTAGTNGNLGQWNGDGDLVDGPDVLDQDDMSSNSSSAVATQQSIKAYVDDSIAAIGTITAGTSQATTSGTSFDFTSIPSGTKRITMNFLGVSLDGSDSPLIQIGDSGGIETGSYVSNSIQHLGGGAHSANASSTSGFIIIQSNATYELTGRLVLELIDSSANTWIATFNGFGGVHVTGTGSKSLSGTLDRIRLTRAGSDDFDAGSVNIIYE